MKLYIKNHWLILLILFVIPIVIIAIFYISTNTEATKLNSEDWLAFSGATISYIGTVVLSLVALHQSEKANQLSKEVFLLTQRDYIVNFSIEKIQKKEIKCCGLKDPKSIRMHFCYVSSTPQTCEGYIISIRNYSIYPITHVSISTSYRIGRNHIQEVLTEEKDLLIAPHKIQKIFLCNTPNFLADGVYVRFLVSCSNLFGNSTELEVKVESTEDENGYVTYSCVLVKTD